jgi:hypothetical protein
MPSLGAHRSASAIQVGPTDGDPVERQPTEDTMVCAFITKEAMLLVSHHPISVFTTTAEHLDNVPKKPDGHYDREHIMKLVNDGHATHYDETAIRTIAEAMRIIIFGCPPR